MKKIVKRFGIMTAIIMGVGFGLSTNSIDTNAQAGCQNLACKHDLISGFRCFDDDTDGYNCNDSQYPGCSEMLCTGVGVN